MKRNQIKTSILTIFATFLFVGIGFAQNFDLPITTSSDEARNLFREGRAYMENIHIAKAIELFDKAIKLDPEFALAHLYRAGTFEGGIKSIKKHLDKAVSRIDNVTGGEKNLILLQQAQFNNNESRIKMYLNNLIVSFPYNKRIQNMAGTYYYGNGDYETALNHFRKSEKIDENYAPNYNMIGYTESELGNYDAAEKAFKKYIELMPDQPNPYDSYAELLLKRGRYDESIAQYEKAYNKDNTFVTALIGVGNNYIFKGDFDKARASYEKCFKKAVSNNNKLAALYWEGISYVHQGDLNKALKVFEKRKNFAKKKGLTRIVIFNTNTEGRLLTEMGHAKKGMKKIKQANRMIEKANLPKSVKESLALNGRLNMCYALTANDRIKDAEKEAAACEEIVNKRGNINEIKNLHSTLALLEMKKGNYQSAINHFEQTDINNSPFNMQKLANVYEKMGNTKMANKYMNKIKTTNQNGLGLALIRNEVKE